VDSDAIAIPHTHRAFGHLLLVRADLQPVSVADAEQQLADFGHPNPRLTTDHRIISASLRTALLRRGHADAEFGRQRFRWEYLHYPGEPQAC